jgi:tetratricopeptide (TPR) repeat protein
MLTGRTYATLQEYAKAETTLKRAVQIDSLGFESTGWLGELYLKQGRAEEALKEFETLAARNPKSVAPYMIMGTIFEGQNRRAEAKEAYRKALGVNAGAALPANNLAFMYAQDNERLDEALQLAQTAKAKLPNSPDAADTLGFIYYKKGLVTSAVAAFKEALNKQPDNPAFKYHLGLAYAKNGDYRMARPMLEEALKRAPNASDANEARATLARLAVIGS